MLPSCDGGEHPVVAAARRTRADSAAVGVRVEVEGVAGAPDVELAGSGVFDFGRRRGRLSFEVRAGRGVPPQAFDVVYDGDRAYVRAPFLSAPGVPPWLAVDVADALDEHEGGVLAIAARSDPAIVLGVLDDLRDEPVEQDASQARYRAGAAAPYGDGPVAVDVWLDARDRVRRVHYTIAVPVPAVAGGEVEQDVATTLTLTSFGEAPDVRVPPASRTIDAHDALDAVGVE